MLRTSFANVRCKVCGSYDTVRDGRIKYGQRWKCKTCGRKFLANHARYGMKTPFVQVQKAIQLYYEGLSLNAICRYLQKEYHNYPSVSTVYDWVVKYSHEAMVATSKCYPNVSDTWVASETPLNVLGDQVWLWDVIDTRTRFLLASKLSLRHNICDFYNVMEQAIGKAGKNPKDVITNNIPLCFEILRYPLMIKYSSRGIECFHEIFHWRSGLMGDLKRLDKVCEFVNGWLIYYNYFRPHKSLGGKTPSEMADINYVYKDSPRRVCGIIK